MTNDRAIQILELDKATATTGNIPAKRMALDRAIEALKKESMCNEILNDVVRCKDCKYSYGTPSRLYCGRYGYNDKMFVREDGFCDRAEKEENK